jgi:hypothetical protein
MNRQRRRELLDCVGPMNLEAARVGMPRAHGYAAPLSINARISSTLHTVIRGPSFSGLGKRPDFTPAHQVVRPIGMGPLGARIE